MPFEYRVAKRQVRGFVFQAVTLNEKEMSLMLRLVDQQRDFDVSEEEKHQARVLSTKLRRVMQEERLENE